MPRKSRTAAAPKTLGGPMPFVEYGDSGISHYGGRLNEEFIPELKGERGRRVLREMAWNDPVIGAGLFVIRMLLRQAPVSVEAGGTSPQDQLAHDLIDSARNDMSLTWEDTVSDICSMLPFGWAFQEVIYKHRVGPWETDGAKRSQHTDGLIGWRKWALRSQLSLDRWELDASGGVQAMVQRPTLGSTTRKERPAGATGMGLVIPITKALLFKTDNAGGNPEGLSVIRNAYKPYYFGKRIEMLEGIGIERDMAGMPEIKIPGAYLKSTAAPEEKAVADAYRRMGEQIRNDRMSSVVLPSDRDKDGHPIYEFNLKGANGRRQFDTNVVLGRYAMQKAIVMLTDFILLGHEKVGSFALSGDKTALFGIALGAWRDSFLAVINRHEIPRLLALNGVRVERPPRFVGGEIIAPSLAELSKLIGELSGAGMPLFPDDALEAAIRKRAGFPAKESEDYMAGKRHRGAKVGSAAWLAEVDELLGEKAGNFDETKHRRHPRGSSAGGKFAPKDDLPREGDTVHFVSPNMRAGMSVEDAERYARSPRQRWFEKQVVKIDGRDALVPAQTGIGCWTDKFEPTVISRLHAGQAAADYLGARKSLAGEQKAFATFTFKRGGKNRYYIVRLGAQSASIAAEACGRAGLGLYTMEPGQAGWSVHVIDLDGSLRDATARLAKSNGVRIIQFQGVGKIPGAEERADARLVFRKLISDYHRSRRRSALRRLDRRGLGPDGPVRRRRSSPLTRKRADLDAEDGDLDPDEGEDPTGGAS